MIIRAITYCVLLILPVLSVGQIRPNITLGENHDGINTIELCLSITNLYDRMYIMQSIEGQFFVIQFVEDAFDEDESPPPMCIDPRDFIVTFESISTRIDQNKLETLRSDSKDFEMFWQFNRNLSVQPGQTLELACIFNNNISGSCANLSAYVDCFGTQFTKFTNGREIPTDTLCPSLDLSPCAGDTMDLVNIDIYCQSVRSDQVSVAWGELTNVSSYEVSVDDGPWEPPTTRLSHTAPISNGTDIKVDIRALTLCEPWPTGSTNCMFIENSSNEVIYIPNAFSPNGDGINDEFTISPISGFRINSVEIYTRYGERVYGVQLDGVSPTGLSWDGTFDGEVLQAQVLLCHITVVNPNGEIESITSDLSLFR